MKRRASKKEEPEKRPPALPTPMTRCSKQLLRPPGPSRVVNQRSHVLAGSPSTDWQTWTLYKQDAPEETRTLACAARLRPPFHEMTQVRALLPALSCVGSAAKRDKGPGGACGGDRRHLRDGVRFSDSTELQRHPLFCALPVSEILVRRSRFALSHSGPGRLLQRCHTTLSVICSALRPGAKVTVRRSAAWSMGARPELL